MMIVMFQLLSVWKNSNGDVKIMSGTNCSFVMIEILKYLYYSVRIIFC